MAVSWRLIRTKVTVPPGAFFHTLIAHLTETFWPPLRYSNRQWLTRGQAEGETGGSAMQVVIIIVLILFIGLFVVMSVPLDADISAASDRPDSE